MQMVARVRRGVPFGIVERSSPGAPPRVLCPLAKDAPTAPGQLHFGVRGFVPQRIGRIVVRADEIDGHIAFLTELEKLFNPRVPCGCRTADLERVVDTLDRVDRVPIKLEIVLSASCPECFEIWFIPHLEEPLSDLAGSIPIDPMAD